MSAAAGETLHLIRGGPNNGDTNQGGRHEVSVQDQRTERSTVATAASDLRGPGEQMVRPDRRSDH